MNQKTRLATAADLDDILTIFESGRAYLKAQGFVQWQCGNGPSQEKAERDIREGYGYVLIIDGKVAGYTSLVPGYPGPDRFPPLTEGSWDERHTQYVAIHSVALAESVRGKGLALPFLKEMIQRAIELGYKDIRIDTHPENQIMQKVMANAGFVRTGTMVIPDTPSGTRHTFQIVLDE